MSYLTSQSAVFSAPTRLRLRIVHGFLSITISAVLAVLGQFSFAVYSVDNLEPVGAPHVINLSITASAYISAFLCALFWSTAIHEIRFRWKHPLHLYIDFILFVSK